MNTSAFGIFSHNQEAIERFTKNTQRPTNTPSPLLRSYRQKEFVIEYNKDHWAPGGIYISSNNTAVVLLGNAYKDTHPISPEELENIHRQEGIHGFHSLSGSFAIILWNGNTRHLTIAMDRLASQKIYVYRDNEAVIFSTEIKPLLSTPITPSRIDPIALAQFLTVSHLVDHRSLVKDIFVCQPATITTWAHHNNKTITYWRPTIGEGHDDGLNMWADRLAEALAPSVRARSNASQLLLPVTGGLDSRVIAGFLPNSALRNLTCCTFGHSHCYDVRYGRRIAQALRAPYKYLPLEDNFFRHYLSFASDLADGEISIEALPMLRLLDCGDAGTTLLSGYLGDTLSGSSLLDLDKYPNETSRYQAVLQNYFVKNGFSDNLLKQVLLPDIYNSANGWIEDFVRDLYFNTESRHPSEKIIAIKLKTRQWRFTSYMSRALGTKYRFEAPFLDNHVLDTFLSMPMPYRLNQRAYRRMLVRHAPLLANIPEIKTHRPVSYADKHGVQTHTNKHHANFRLPAALKWRKKQATRRLGEFLVRVSNGWLGPHDRDHYAHHDESIRCVDPEWFRSKLLDDPHAAEWFDLNALRQLFEEHMSRRQDHSIRINNVVAFLAWYEAMR